jgi:hypothetical protein
MVRGNPKENSPAASYRVAAAALSEVQRFSENVHAIHSGKKTGKCPAAIRRQ